MYINGIKINQNSTIRPSYAKQFGNVSNPVFRQSAADLTCQSSKLVKTYLQQFTAELKDYEAEGAAILQPSKISEKILQKIAESELLKMQNFPKNHTLFIVTGRIGGGKTTFVQKNNLQKFFYSPDADEIKLLLPGYNEFGSSYVHKASCTINSANISEALKRGINTVIQTATTIDNLDNIIDEARDYSYKDIILVHLDTDEEIAIKRAESRGALTGRKIDPEIIRDRKYIDSIVSSYSNPARGLSQLIVYDNNGDSPVKTDDINFHTEENLTYVTESSD